ncbi:DUF4271 domain-containing protein [uncultured Rikenella sp.]|uniref:DUF4271 domain-containing protein n=1 Tax=uncultured Rikenella sp. TaxID=368003 RepID=UPI00262D44F2|nr:DUF4271 domain-containing protein [uncultured Rikenella sp.]
MKVVKSFRQPFHKIRKIIHHSFSGGSIPATENIHTPCTCTSAENSYLCDGKRFVSPLFSLFGVDTASSTYLFQQPGGSTLFPTGPETVGRSVDSVQWLRPAGSAAEVWGGRSTLSEELTPHGGLVPVSPPADPWQTSVVMVVLICFYCYVLYRFRRDMVSCLKNIGHTEDTLTLMEGQGADFVYFLRSGIALAVLAGSALVMAWLEIRWPRIESYYLFIGSVVLFLLIVLYRRILFRVLRWLTDDKSVFQEITFINRIDVTFISLLYAPLAIVIGVSGRLFAFGLVVLGGLVVYHFIALYKYFRLRSFSKLQWILYLCFVEILPVSFILALAIRQSSSVID